MPILKLRATLVILAAAATASCNQSRPSPCRESGGCRDRRSRRHPI